MLTRTPFRCEETRYKDIPAVRVEGGGLSLLVLPQQGGKLASLLHLASGRELLWQAPGEQYRPLTYTGDYVAAECSGVDDMFPTIDPAPCSALPYSDIQLPDHGEVCRLPWRYQMEAGSLRLWVEGRCLPYTLEKRIRPVTGGLRIAYRADNLSHHDIPFLWASHAMLRAEAQGEITIPGMEDAEIALMFSADPSLGARGDRLRWPGSGDQRRNRTGPYTPGGNTYKYYFTHPLQQGRCTYRYPSDGLEFAMTFPVDSVPYLGVWINEGGFQGIYNLAFEPATAPYDRPDLAAAHGACSVLPAGGCYTWWLELTVSAPHKNA